MPKHLSLDQSLAKAGLVVDQTGRIPVALGSSTYSIEAHDTPKGYLLRCDVDSPGSSLAAYAEPLSRLGSAEPGTTEVLVANQRLTVVRHIGEATPQDLRTAAQRLAEMTQMAAGIAEMLRTADAADGRLKAAPGARFPDLDPALVALERMPLAGVPGPALQPAPTSAVAKPGKKAPGLVGLAGGWAIVTAMAIGISSLIGTIVTLPNPVLDIAVTWAIVGLFQVSVLQHVFSRRFLWFPVTLVGGVMGDYLAITLSNNAPLPVTYIVFMLGGALTGLVQCLYLRKRVSGWWWWIAANAAAPALQLFVIVNLPTPLLSGVPDTANIAATGAISGLVLGAVTGVSLAVLRARTKLLV